jgi:sugar lactone lactonase YvrE
MDAIVELVRVPSLAPRPQSLVFQDPILWMVSLGTNRLYAIDPLTWTVRDEVPVPGAPFGLTLAGDELRVLCESADDHRTIVRYVPGEGFIEEDVIPVPDDTGSQLSHDGSALYMSQWYKKCILAFDGDGGARTVVTVPHEICGQVIVDGHFYLVTTDDENTDDYWLTRVVVRDGRSTSKDVARIGFAARGLAFDGTRFWTNHREQHQIVAFGRPG